MVNQSIALVLILAVLACPIWCSAGLCQSLHGGSMENPKSKIGCAIEGSAQRCCCCQHESSNNDEQVPGRCPRESSCQGVCGGAVFEKPCELTAAESACVAPPALCDDLQPCGLLTALRGHRGYELCCDDPVDGRQLRILYRSFLC
ncbi:MAG: hypothetical protein H7Z17_05465 [Fuerstia sp.]|nr:hypothetical protein [Fuerstiella sp.]